ncbi:glycine betaine/proline transport system substrate-binding protein [Limimonas halophila]|uniref:Glycine betaine/proline transport system substrate-binding protein n=1 Tax=Limimonas halophila TaxID=1082479 RepID=A0A1G7TWV3_9PROT|nr:ABC transporter substrate-binding protein [Limimonas halophila]SDG39219.1 glycine betaine/proline transport system substrate-binding protein [Limimonas halophila]
MTGIRTELTAPRLAAFAVAGALALTAGMPRPASASEPIRFAVQAWPGVTVKTAVATRVLEAMGYRTETRELGSQFIYKGIESGEVDVSFGAWMPAHKSMLQPLLDKGEAVQLAANLKGAIQGLAVPTSVCEAGITSVEDLVANGERFGRKIYAIEPGAGMTRAFKKAVKNDYQGLGDWEVVPSSVAGMLAQVERAVGKDEAIVFHGWKPHWMDVKFDICFLDDKESSEIAALETTVHTVIPDGWTDANPNVARFLKQFRVEPSTQSRWIHAYSYKDRELDRVARQWIERNLDTIEGWLKGVTAKDGGPAIDAVRAAYGSS